ncbi:hypothetical protein AURANDRAFT_32720 [Aureococcus anophagefferens]|uniref:Cell division control protein 45 n=1 Tax=Aureococcus anophagefferens TaxID=44056 RepID=F0YKG8_AURAN|nr:hypothetical protein AURANDRAFT_32720 [Aureococcus anophagefferens]EGB04400.1 hypothetical protein AURANDRAFT_32720 [Aureococcus anophagefferens]|eukprot:XP_009040957.1 hypothetical protein AURANDRAFT_32720 [Aureococcus anophagefferens]
MLIGRERFEEVYNTIKQSACAGGACTVLILVAPDCDAVCGCHILTRLLRDDNVPFKVTPVAGYGDVAAATVDVADAFSEIRSVVMLNCGGTVNLEALFGGGAATIFVVDSHRPFHLRNVHSGGRVVVLDAEPLDAGDCPSDGEDLDGDFMDSDDDLSESDEESDGGDDDDDEADGDNSDDGSRKRSARDARRAEKRAKRESQDAAGARKRRVRAYYDGTYDGPPSSALLFALGEGVARSEHAELWLAALGLTFARGQFRIADDARAEGAGPGDAELAVPGRGYQAPPGTVTFEAEELRFMLHRHWPLFDAMYYSNYVAARLSVWKADGKRKLQELLAKIGLSLEHCKQRFAFLSEAQRASMKERLRDQGPAYDLDDPFTTSFHRVSASGDVVSAQDAAAIVEALLEGHALDCFLKGFWQAYDACLPDDGALLAQGIRAATLLQRSVVQQAVSMVEKKEITTLRHFRYAYITSATSDVFAKPLAVRKLALFLLGVHQHNGKWAADKDKPLVVLAERRDTFLVVGVSSSRGASKNRLAHAFKLAAEHIKADVAHDWFDSAVIEVLHDDVQRFVESLHYIMQHVN